MVKLLLIYKKKIPELKQVFVVNTPNPPSNTLEFTWVEHSVIQFL